MKRGELYRVYRGSRHDPKDSRVFLVVSRQMLIDNTFSGVICAPVYSNYRGIKTQVLLFVLVAVDSLTRQSIWSKSRCMVSYSRNAIL